MRVFVLVITFLICQLASCDVEGVLTDVEHELIPMAFSLDAEELEKWMNLLGKAIKVELIPEEVRGLPFIEPLIHDCEFLQCACGKDRWLS